MMTIGHKPTFSVLLHMRVYELTHSTFEVNWPQVRFVWDSGEFFQHQVYQIQAMTESSQPLIWE